MTTISEDYAHIAMSESSEVALKILKRESDSIICIVHTHKSQASDSYLKFYTKDWTELPTNNFIRIPNAKDFLTINDTISPSEREKFFPPRRKCLSQVLGCIFQALGCTFQVLGCKFQDLGYKFLSGGKNFYLLERDLVASR